MKYVPNNFFIDTDIYKLTHPLQYPNNFSKAYDYGEARTGAKHPKVLFYGLQPILMEHFDGIVMDVDKLAYAVKKSRAYFGGHTYINEANIRAIIKAHNGHLPVEIKAVKEGSLVPVNNVLFTTETLDPDFAPYLGTLETLLMHVWYPTTLATRGFYRKLPIYEALEKSGNPELIEYMVHDFGYRGVTCQEQACRGGMAHLINFRGSDTTVGDRGLEAYYGYKEGSILKSVWATEHSVATAYGPGRGEYEYVLEQLRKAPDHAIISLVADTYDIDNFTSVVLADTEIREKIINRSGRFVVRPDSGDPELVVNRVLNNLARVFGLDYVKGYKLINHNVGVLQGDGMNEQTIPSLYENIMLNGWSANNLVTGSGGGLLQNTNRDEERFAVKLAYAEFNGIPTFPQKNPKSDPSKASKTGLLKLHKAAGKYSTLSSKTEAPAMFNSYHDELETVFYMGKLVRKQTADEVRALALSHFYEELTERQTL